ncbi:MAG: nucleotidyltransferase [Bacteroidetes bacterium]|nr:nucleotidyltransferase [Bacteroidota bacterium]
MFHKDYKEFIELLIAKEVKYLIVGGHSVIAHGYLRSTVDLDVWFRADSENVDLVLKCLIDFGLGSLGVSAADLLKRGRIVQLGVAPVRIDLINEVDGIEFDDCYSHRLVKEVYGLSVNFLSYDDLIKNKKASGRNKDLDDIENLS